MIDHTSSVSPALESDGPWLTELRAALQGELIAPDDAGYDGARAPFYGGLDRRPALIVRAASAADVAQAVTFARERGLELAVRGGGHSMAGHSTTEGGLLLDLGPMKGLEIDVAGRTAWAEAGLTAGEYTAATAAHGLGTGFGDTGSVGIAGITLGGGVGYLVRKHGLTIDDLLAAEIVTADGRLRHVDAATEPELFWAIRGGGGNFGVVTRFKYRLHELGAVYAGMLLLPATPAVIAGFVAAAEAAPEELSAIINVMKAPPMPFLPAEAHGKLVLMAYLVYTGPAEAGERALAPFRALTAPLADTVKPMPYAEIYPPEEGGYHPIGTARTLFRDSVDLAAAETIVEALQASTAMMAVTQLRALGGAMARVPADATAFAHRGARIMVNVAALYPRPEEAAIHEPWVVALADALRQGEEGAYVNFVGDEGEARVRAAYPGATWARLVAIKTRYDPTNLFRRNHNIPPAAAS